MSLVILTANDTVEYPKAHRFLVCKCSIFFVNTEAPNSVIVFTGVSSWTRNVVTATCYKSRSHRICERVRDRFEPLWIPTLVPYPYDFSYSCRSQKRLIPDSPIKILQ